LWWTPPGLTWDYAGYHKRSEPSYLMIR
jgi:hypothetical protein